MLMKDCFVSAAKVVKFLVGAKLVGHKAAESRARGERDRDYARRARP